MSRNVLAAVCTCIPVVLSAQWTNRYPKNAGYNHQVYLEGYELPIMASGPIDPAPSPDGRSVVMASRGWLWQLDLATGRAQRITSSGGVDSRPAWSRDGKLLAFVRDDSRTTAVVVRDMTTGVERELERGLALDPVFTADGASVVYANVQPGGDLDLWRMELSTGTRTRLTTDVGLELRPQLHPDGTRLVYTSKTRAGGDQIRLRSLDGNAESTLLVGNLLSQMRGSLSPNGAELAYNWPNTGGWELRLVSIDRPAATTLLVAKPRGRPLTPAWSPDGRWIYFSQADAQQQLHLFRVNRNGGDAQEVAIGSWDYGVPTGRLSLSSNGPTRLHIQDASGHPIIPSTGMIRFDGQNGLIYFYSPGTTEIEAPAGPLEITAVRGLTTPPTVSTVVVSAGGVVQASIATTSLWDAERHGWYAGDHHFHLNYGGPIDLAPQDLAAPLAGEAVDVGTPMLANLHNRFENQEHWTYRSAATRPLVVFAQEVRSHFLGHVGLVGTSELFWPWVWGPGYEVHGRDDRLNAAPLAEARRQGGAGIYVHPVFVRDPFSEQGLSSIPAELVADAVHGDVDLLELVCLWSSEIGTTELWYRLLNAGLPVMPSGGTDAMTDLHRTMALGSARVYVRPDGPFTWDSYLAGLKAGRSFVTTGPMVELTVESKQPGDVLARGGREVAFTLDVYSAMPVDSVAIVVNGRALWSAPVMVAPFSQHLTGRLRLPAGGWVGARVVGPVVDRWPAMASRTFAHTAPIWIGTRGSTDASSRHRAAADLLRALDNAERRLEAAYAGTPTPVLKAHFASARELILSMAR